MLMLSTFLQNCILGLSSCILASAEKLTVIEHQAICCYQPHCGALHLQRILTHEHLQ